MVLKPIWCKCEKTSWTRRQLYNAWVANREIRCPEPSCQREISLDDIEDLLVDLGMLNLDDDDDIEEMESAGEE